MFTGIIEDVGLIEALVPSGEDIRLSIKTDKLDMSDVSLGDSIGAKFLLTLIPHSLEETIIGRYIVGTKVNLEVDVIARYLERLMLGDKAAYASTDTDKKDISMAFLAENGYLK